jgi:hypothetical protein
VRPLHASLRCQRVRPYARRAAPPCPGVLDAHGCIAARRTLPPPAPPTPTVPPSAPLPPAPCLPPPARTLPGPAPRKPPAPVPSVPRCSAIPILFDAQIPHTQPSAAVIAASHSPRLAALGGPQWRRSRGVAAGPCGGGGGWRCWPGPGAGAGPRQGAAEAAGLSGPRPVRDGRAPARPGVRAGTACCRRRRRGRPRAARRGRRGSAAASGWAPAPASSAAGSAARPPGPGQNAFNPAVEPKNRRHGAAGGGGRRGRPSHAAHGVRRRPGAPRGGGGVPGRGLGHEAVLRRAVGAHAGGERSDRCVVGPLPGQPRAPRAPPLRPFGFEGRPTIPAAGQLAVGAANHRASARARLQRARAAAAALADRAHAPAPPSPPRRLARPAPTGRARPVPERLQELYRRGHGQGGRGRRGHAGGGAAGGAGREAAPALPERAGRVLLPLPEACAVLGAAAPCCTAPLLPPPAVAPAAHHRRPAPIPCPRRAARRGARARQPGLHPGAPRAQHAGLERPRGAQGLPQGLRQGTGARLAPGGGRLLAAASLKLLLCSSKAAARAPRRRPRHR